MKRADKTQTGKEQANRAISAEMQRTAELFAALGQPSRLLLLRLIWHEALSGERLTELSGLSAGTVSHHLSALRAVELIETEQQGYWRLHCARVEALQVPLADMVTGRAVLASPTVLSPEVTRSNTEGHTEGSDLVTFGRVQRLPRTGPERERTLEALAATFDVGRTYTETEVRLRLQGHEPSAAELQRALVRGGWLQESGGLFRKASIGRGQG